MERLPYKIEPAKKVRKPLLKDFINVLIYIIKQLPLPKTYILEHNRTFLNQEEKDTVKSFVNFKNPKNEEVEFNYKKDYMQEINSRTPIANINRLS